MGYLTSSKRTKNSEWSLWMANGRPTDMLCTELNANVCRYRRHRRHRRRPPIFGERLLIYFILFLSTGCSISIHSTAISQGKNVIHFPLLWYDYVCLVHMFVCSAVLYCAVLFNGRTSKMIRLFSLYLCVQSSSSLAFLSFHFLMWRELCLHSDPASMRLQSIGLVR